MNLKQEAERIRTLFEQGTDLLLLRLRLLKTDAQAQLADVVKIIVAAAAASVCCLVGLIALLFGLYAVLPQEAKAAVFFGLTGLFLLTAVVLAVRIPAVWHGGSRRTDDTLQALQEDWRIISGRRPQERNGDGTE